MSGDGGFAPILAFAHALVRERVRSGDWCVDATAGNGRDTLFLAELAGPEGRVYAFDVQEAALTAAESRLDAAGIEPSRRLLMLRSHAEMAEALGPEAAGRIGAVMFNLGYLPGGDHRVVTKPESTIAGLRAALTMLRDGGVLTVVVYTGHEGAAAEAEAVDRWAAGLPQERYEALTYRFLNRRNAPPYMIAVAKQGWRTTMEEKQPEATAGKTAHAEPYPLKFRPEFKERVWGARELERFGFAMPEGRIGEAWMIGEHPNGTTAVADGALAGWRLDDIREAFGEAWLGRKGISPKTGRFPLLVKLLDCSDDLSVQVHPDDSYERLATGELGKTEMWYVLDAKPGAKIVYGLRQGADRAALETAVRSGGGAIMDCLREMSVEAGDTFYIPAGTVHALGSGVLVAEIQQNSDTTYRLYDYDRPGLDGKPRDLHIEDSLNVIAYDGSGASFGKTEPPGDNVWLRLAASPYFIVEKGRVREQWRQTTEPDSFHILIACEGEGALQWSGGQTPLCSGDCCLLPANLGAYALTGDITLLRAYIP